MALTKATYSMIDGAVVNVLDYGADPTASSDSTAAIQAAIDACPNGTVFFPSGAYNITSTLKIEYNVTTGKNSVNLVGAGLGSTLFWNGGNNTSFVWYEATSAFAGTFSQTRIENLFFKNTVAATGLIGIRLGNSASPLGIQAGIQNMTIKNNKFYAFYIGVQTEYESDGCVIEKNVFEEFSLYGVYNTGTSCMRIKDNYFQMGLSGSVAIYSEYVNITIVDNLIQSSNTGILGDIHLKNSTGFTIDNNYFEHAPGANFTILLSNTNTGYIGNNLIQGYQGANCIYIDATSGNITIDNNSYAFYTAAPNSLVYAVDGSYGVNIIGTQNFVGGSISSPIQGGYNYVVKQDYLMLGTANYTATPNPGITMAKSGVINIGNTFGPSGWGFMSFNRTGTQIGSITQSGATGVAFNTSSDYRLKDNVQPMQNALTTVSKLNPVTYTWKADNSNGQGFIAHELQSIVPECVTGVKDAVDENGKPIYQGVDTSFLVATLTKAIQELKAEIDALKGAK